MITFSKIVFGLVFRFFQDDFAFTNDVASFGNGNITTKKAVEDSTAFLSEWPDSNGRPLAPHARMLANCTTPRLP